MARSNMKTSIDSASENSFQTARPLSYTACHRPVEVSNAKTESSRCPKYKKSSETLSRISRLAGTTDSVNFQCGAQGQIVKPFSITPLETLSNCC